MATVSHVVNVVLVISCIISIEKAKMYCRTFTKGAHAMLYIIG